MKHLINVLNSTGASFTRFWRGTDATPSIQSPKKVLELYDIEGCPYCRLVREVLTELDLDVKIYPCPKKGVRFRLIAERLGGKQQFPFFVDPNTKVSMYESADIIKYLYNTYAQTKVPLIYRSQLVNIVSSSLATIVRLGAGLKVIPSETPTKSLELYSFESSPFSRIVRELLCQLELPYVLRNIGKAELIDYIIPPIRKRVIPQKAYHGRNRSKLAARTGKVMAPYLVDPNTGKEMYESLEIVKYLKETYAI